MLKDSRRISGIRLASLIAVLVGALGATACNYSFRAGAGFPEHIRTVAILPFENETSPPRFELTDEILQLLMRELPRALGVQLASEDVADAVIRGVIRRYDLTAPNYRQAAQGGAAQVLQRQVRLAIAVEIIDLQENMIIFEDRSLSAEGQYLEASETEEDGRAEAIELLVQKIVDGAQSNW